MPTYVSRIVLTIALAVVPPVSISFLWTAFATAPVWADDGGDGGDGGGRDGGDRDGGDSDGGDSDGRDGDDRDRDRDDNDDNDRDDRARSPAGGIGREVLDQTGALPRQLQGIIRNIFGTPRREAPQTRRASPAPPSLPDRAENEIVAPGLSDEDLATLTAQGFTVLEERAVPVLNSVSRRLRPPQGVQLTEARETVRALPSGATADFNHFYRTEQAFSDSCQGADCPARWSIGWNILPDRSQTCGGDITIGMIDTGINDEHATFNGARLDVYRLAPDDFDPSRAIHGTAIASQLVGDPASRSPGLIPGARLIAVDAFYRRGSDERADVFTLINALGFLAEAEVQILNLSLAGPANSSLAEVVDWLVVERDIAVVAAVGNAGPRARPAYPAAYDSVIAVTAIDRNGAIYRRAVRGAHVDLAAPGVNVWAAASISGARHKTGTSFAVPFVSAAVAHLRLLRPDLSAVEVAQELRSLAEDLGEEGPDSVFGAGRLSLDVPCLRRT